MDLVRDLTAAGADAGWSAWDDDPRASFGAILSPAGRNDAPLAWARLLLPGEPDRSNQSDPRCACLVLYAELLAGTGDPAPPASLESWYQRFSTVLTLPSALAGQLALTTAGNPAAETGLWLTAPRTLTQLADPGDLKSVPGPARPAAFTRLAVADAAGGPVTDTAQAWLREMCDSALRLDGYEPLLARLAAPTQLPPGGSLPRAHHSQRASHAGVIPRRPAITAAAAGVAAAGLLAVVPGLTSDLARDPAPARRPATRGHHSSYPTGHIIDTPAVAGGTVYVANVDGTMYALKAATDRRLWTTGRSLVVPVGRRILNAIYSRPVLAENSIYVGSFNHNVYALNVSNGHVRWTYHTGNKVTSSPAVADGTVYIGSKDRYVYALNTRNGHVRWKYRTGGTVQSSPAVAGHTVYVGSGDGNVYALNTRNGHVRWAKPIGPFVLSSPLVAGGTVYVGSGDKAGDVYALDARTGHVRWARPTGRWVFFSSPVLADGIIYIGSSNGEVCAFNAATDRPLWKHSIGKPTLHVRAVIQGYPAVSAGTVYIGSLLDDKLYALNARTGQIERSYPTGWGIAGSPVIADSTVYVGSGGIHALKTIQGTGSP